MKKRILQFIGSFHQGGSERQAVALARMLKNEGSFEVFAATLTGEGILRPEMDAIGLGEIPEFPLTSFFNANFVRQARRCAQYLRDNKIDLVHTHDFYTNVFGMAAATLAGTRAPVASKRETTGLRTSAQEFVERLAFGRSTAILVNSACVREHLTKMGIAAEKLNLIYNGLDLERFDTRAVGAPLQNLPVADGSRFITMVANLRSPVKNVPMLLRAAARVTQGRSDIHFVIAGEGELEPELREAANRLGVSKNVHFIGRCTDVPALLAASYACVLTSAAEGFSNSILEYMAASKPVVATNVGGAAEAITDGKSGFLGASDDDEAMAKRLIGLLDDETKAKEMGSVGRRIVEQRFSSRRQLLETTSLYEKCLSAA